jgi:uncharacterized delta-60 repeat protein
VGECPRKLQIEVKLLSEHRSLPVAFLLSIIAALFLASSASAAPAGLDPSFGSGGIAKNALGYGSDGGAAVAVQPDGKTVVVGSSQDPVDTSNDQFVFSRYLENGSLDPTFGIGGQAAVSFGSGEAAALDIAIQPDGKILAVGYDEVGGDYDMAIARINANGTLDAGFRGGGNFSIDVTTGIDDDGKAIALAPDGTFYVVGEGFIPGDLDFMILKFEADGDDDLTFGGGDGRHFTHFNGDDGAFAAAVQQDGKLLVAGYAGNGTDTDMAITRYESDGTADNTFSGNGKLDFGIGSMDDSVSDIALTTDGRIVVAGSAGTGDGNAFVAARVTPGGELDPTFDADGKASFKVGTADGPRGMVLRRDGKILITGAIVQSGVSRGGFVQFTADGAVDLGFGVGGYVTTLVGTSTIFSGAAQAPDGKVLAAGQSDGDTVVARYIGEYVAPAPAPIVALKTKFSSKLKSRMKAKKLTSIAGTAVGTGLTKIQVSIGLADKKLLKKNRCLFVKNSKGETKKYKAKKKKCAPAKWLTATGTTNWSYKLKRKLKPGKYTIYVRALDASGATQTSFSRSRGNLRTVTVTK